MPKDDRKGGPAATRTVKVVADTRTQKPAPPDGKSGTADGGRK